MFDKDYKVEVKNISTGQVGFLRTRKERKVLAKTGRY